MIERMRSQAAREAGERKERALETLQLEDLKAKITSELHLEDADYKDLPGEDALETINLRIGVIKSLASEHLQGLGDLGELEDYQVQEYFSDIFKMAAITDWPADQGRIRHLQDTDAADAAVDELVGLYKAKLDRQTESE